MLSLGSTSNETLKAQRYSTMFPWRKNWQNAETNVCPKKMSPQHMYSVHANGETCGETMLLSQNMSLALERRSAHAGSTILDCTLSILHDFTPHYSTLRIPF